MNYTGKDSLKKLWTRRDERSPFDNILVIPTTEPDTSPLAPDRSEALEEAFEKRPEYQQAELNIRNQEISRELATNELLPELNLTGTWTQLGLDDNVPESVDSLTSGRFYDWSVGVSIEVALPYRGPMNRYRNARDSLRKGIVQKQKLENSIVIEVDQAIRELRFARRAVENLAAQVRLQEALLEAEKSKLEAGKSIAYTVS
jgi:outer membrane protein TolC